jgi:hypothetical protein
MQSSKGKVATGTVDRIYVDRDLVIIYLAYDNTHQPPPVEPSSGEFRIPRGDNDNSNALFSLALAAAANQWILTIRTTDTITADAAAEVLYLWMGKK